MSVRNTLLKHPWIREYFWIIAAVIYVGGMFPIFGWYVTHPANRFEATDAISLISVGGAFLLFLQFFIGAWYATTPGRARRPDDDGNLQKLSGT